MNLFGIRKLILRTGIPPPTVRFRGIGTGISEASKRVPSYGFSFASQGGKQVSSYFRQRN